MADDGVRTTSTKLTDTDPGHGHETRTRESMSKLGIPGKPEKRTLREREFGQHSLQGKEGSTFLKKGG